MHTNQTPNLGLSQFIGTDKPTWLGDYNDDMAKIDEGVGSAAANAESAAESATNAAQSAAKAVSDVADLSLKIAGYDSQIASAQTDATQAKSDAQTALNTANGLSSQVTAAATAAQTAQTTASTAQQTANQALTAAGTAQSRADDAYELASQGGSTYVLPTATSSRLGGVKIGSGINVEADGTISVTGGGGGGGTPGSNSITTDMLQNNCVTSNKIATNAVTTDAIQNGAVTSGKIGSGAVSMANLENEVQQAINSIPDIEFSQLYSSSSGSASASLSSSIANYKMVVVDFCDAQGRIWSETVYNNSSASVSINTTRFIPSANTQGYLEGAIVTINGTSVSIGSDYQWFVNSDGLWNATETGDFRIKAVVGINW